MAGDQELQIVEQIASELAELPADAWSAMPDSHLVAGWTAEVAGTTFKLVVGSDREQSKYCRLTMGDLDFHRTVRDDGFKLLMDLAESVRDRMRQQRLRQLEGVLGMLRQESRKPSRKAA